MHRGLLGYFPRPLQEAYAAQIARHRLHREIIATVVTNEVINRVGVTFVHEVKEKTGMTSADIARAYTVSREVFAMDDLFAEIEALDNKAPAALQAGMLIECGRLIERGTTWFLRQGPHPLDIGAQVEQTLRHRAVTLSCSPIERCAAVLHVLGIDIGTIAQKLTDSSYITRACGVV